MAQAPLWHAIKETLTDQIAAGEYAPGDKLPTEAILASRFGVNRHTVRRALSEMAEQGHVFARRGSGVFVAQQPTEYPIGKRVRFHDNLRAAGHAPSKDILTFETRNAGPAEQAALALQKGEKVHVYESLALSDDLPIAFSRSFFPAAPFPDLLVNLKQNRSVTKALAECGVTDYTRSSTRLTAQQADPTLALHLRLPQKAALLYSVGINVDQTGRPVEWGHTWFAGERVTLTLADL